MNNKNFTDYLFDKMEQNKAEMSFYAQTEKCDLECVKSNEKFNLSIMTTNDYLAWSIKGYCFEPKHRKAMLAFIDSYNDMADRKYKLHILFGERKIMVSYIIACANNESVEKSIDDAIDFFINTCICKEQRTSVHRERIMKNIMMSVRKGSKYAGYYWHRNKEEKVNA